MIIEIKDHLQNPGIAAYLDGYHVGFSYFDTNQISGVFCWYEASPTKSWPITSRTIDHYPFLNSIKGSVTGIEIRDIDLAIDQQWLEIGPGLGFLVPHLVEHGIKPVIVDPLDYRLLGELAAELVQEAAQKGYVDTFGALNEYIDHLKYVVNIMLSDNVVRHQLSFYESIKKKLLPRNFFDFVVESAVLMHLPNEEKNKLMLKSLAKPTGMTTA